MINVYILSDPVLSQPRSIMPPPTSKKLKVLTKKKTKATLRSKTFELSEDDNSSQPFSDLSTQSASQSSSSLLSTSQSSNDSASQSILEGPPIAMEEDNCVEKDTDVALPEVVNRGEKEKGSEAEHRGEKEKGLVVADEDEIPDALQVSMKPNSQISILFVAHFFVCVCF